MRRVIKDSFKNLLPADRKETKNVYTFFVFFY